MTAAIARSDVPLWEVLEIVSSKSESGARSQLSKWTTGKAEPTRFKVLELEELLDCQPGDLSCHLGWLPVSAENIVSTEQSISLDSRLTIEQREALLQILRTFLNE